MNIISIFKNIDIFLLFPEILPAVSTFHRYEMLRLRNIKYFRTKFSIDRTMNKILLSNVQYMNCCCFQLETRAFGRNKWEEMAADNQKELKIDVCLWIEVYFY